ncbi:hypothetical protein J6590_057246 [Homalodisca vitripennis]|nr:hypothetical protein J6590_057246 [Homalodisca vitripennis]
MPYLFTSEEYADMVFILGYCNGNARAAVEEYELRYPNRRIPDTKTISGTFRTLRETGSLPSTRTNYERAVQLDDDIVINAVHRSPGVSTRRISRRIGVSQSTVWRSLNLYSGHWARTKRRCTLNGSVTRELMAPRKWVNNGDWKC